MQIILASNNQHKRQEIAEILRNAGINNKILTLKELNINDFNPIENGNTFAENAAIKACALYEMLHAKRIKGRFLILADDSGLSVEALNGAPGVHSARFGRVMTNDSLQSNSSDDENNLALQKCLKNAGVWGSKAHFECSIAFIMYDLRAQSSLDSMQCVSGICKGIVATKMLGSGGFGYDSMFYVTQDENIDFSAQNTQYLESLNRSLATLSMQEKNKISHRYKALEKLVEILKTF